LTSARSAPATITAITPTATTATKAGSRALSAVLLAGAAALAAAFALAVLSDAYGRISAEQRAAGGSNLAAVSAARHASRLQPWRVGFRIDLAWTLGVRGDVAAMRAEYRRALSWAPASAYAWLEYAQSLARAHRLDPEYTLALSRASFLSHARPVQLQIARMGANHWSEGGEQDRGLWARNMAVALRSSPNEFLWQVLRARREGPVCGYVGAELGLSRWCAAVSSARQICDGLAPGAKGAAVDQCHRLGLSVTTDETARN
jgi:hypothetical protein